MLAVMLVVVRTSFPHLIMKLWLIIVYLLGLSFGYSTELKIIPVRRVVTQCVAAAGQSQDAGSTFAYYKENRP